MQRDTAGCLMPQQILPQVRHVLDFITPSLLYAERAYMALEDNGWIKSRDGSQQTGQSLPYNRDIFPPSYHNPDLTE